jgi:hypothetical protein
VCPTDKLGYERAHNKLLTVTECMGRECNMPRQVVIALISMFELSLLPFGALDSVVSNNWTLPVAEVSTLLDQYRWKDDAKREHMQLLLSMVLRAVGDFRSELQHVMQLGSAVEIEGRLSRALKRANTETQRAFDKHGQVLPTTRGYVHTHVESLLQTLSAPCAERVHEIHQRAGSDAAPPSNAEEDDEVARFAERLEAAHIK